MNSKFAALPDFFHSYFHQDWQHVYTNESDLIADFLLRGDIKWVAMVEAQLAQLLNDLPVDEINSLSLFDEFHSYCEPVLFGETNHGWLSKLLMLMRREEHTD